MILTCLVTNDRLAYTKRCLASYWATRRKGDRLVVVDNASTDGTVEWLRKLRLRVIFNTENRYPGAACNQGWDAGLRWRPTYLHRSDNDIEYLPGWGDEIERQFVLNPAVSLLGVLNLHEDLGIEGDGIEQVEAVGGNVVIPVGLYAEGLRWDEAPWPAFEDGEMSRRARGYGLVARLGKTVANNMAFGRYWDFPDYYDRTARVRGLRNPEVSV